MKPYHFVFVVAKDVGGTVCRNRAKLDGQRVSSVPIMLDRVIIPAASVEESSPAQNLAVGKIQP